MLNASELDFSESVRDVVNVDVKSVPEREREQYRALVAEYFGALRELSIFLTIQTAALRALEAQRDRGITRTFETIIDIRGCKALMVRVMELCCHVFAERKEVSIAIEIRVMRRSLIFPAILSPRMSFIEVSGLRVIKANLRKIERHLAAIRLTMGDSHISCQELILRPSPRVELAQTCLTHLEKAHSTVLRGE